jgi:hypothetical protein
MKLNIFRSLPSKSPLTRYLISSVGWLLILAGSGKAYAQETLAQEPDFDFEDAPTSQLFDEATALDVAEEPETTKKTRTKAIDPNQLIAQVNIPTVNQIVVPNLPPLVAPQSTQISPLNSISAPTILTPPDNTPAVPVPYTPIEPKPQSSQDPRYILAPEQLDPRDVDPFSTQFVLNGNKISHFTDTLTTAGYDGGNFRNSNLRYDVLSRVNDRNIQSVAKDRVLRVNSQIETVGVRSVAQNHRIDVSVAQPQTLIGLRQQISLDGGCPDLSGGTCTFLPGLRIDDSIINQRKLIPNGVITTSRFGDVIPQNSLNAIRQPGFQQGAPGNENYGLDLYFPVVGVAEVVTPPPLTGRRQEEIKYAAAVNYTRMNQNFANNGVESVLGRTIRSFNYIDKDRNQLLGLAVSALGQMIPDLEPTIVSGKPGAAIVVNPNLFRAANALRIPDNSLTAYQSGVGYAPSRGEDPKVPPGANHTAIWMGLSPIVEREFSRDYYYNTLRTPVITNVGGSEGGSVPVDVTLDGINFNSNAIQNVYAQAYISVYNRDVDRYDVDTIRQRTDYYPHISLTGTSMTENTIWRYFGGGILNLGDATKTNKGIKAYIGTDYSAILPSGTTVSLGGVGYLNPDPEYSSQVFLSATQSIVLRNNRRTNLVFGVNANHIFDGAITLQSLPIRTTQSYLNIGATANFGDISVGGTQFIGGVLPESQETKTLFNLGWKISNRLNASAFYTARDRNISTTPYGATMSYTLDPDANSTIFAGWNSAAIDFRRTLGARANVFVDNTFTLSVKHQF